MARLRKHSIAFLCAWQLVAIPAAPVLAEQTVDHSGHSLLPVPKHIALSGRFTFPENIAIRLIGVPNPKIAGGVERLVNDLKQFIGSDKITIDSGQSSFSQTAWILTLQNHQPSHPYPQPEQNGTCHLTVSADEGLLEAQDAYGILLGLQTFRQLITQQDNQANIQVATIDDAPRFTWRAD